MAENDLGKIVEMFRDNSDPIDDDRTDINGNHNQVAGHDIINIYTYGDDNNVHLYISFLLMILIILVLAV